MNIKILYETCMDDLKAVKDYVNKKDNVISDIEILKELLKTEHVEKSQIVFYVQILFNSSMKTKHHKIFIKHIYNYVSENICDFRQYLLLLKIIKIVIVKENLLMSDLLIKMLTKILKVETKKSLNRNYEEILKITTDDQPNEVLQFYLIESIISLLKIDINKYSKHVSFPEITSYLIIGLKEIPNYKQFLIGFIEEITERSELIKSIRSDKQITYELPTLFN